MANEIERKYLVAVSAWKPDGQGTHYKQGYLNSQKERVVRVRLEGDAAKLTIKGVTTGITRLEFEYDIPRADAIALLDMCEQPLIEKRRHKQTFGGKIWEIDVFLGDNAGLVIAEVELESETVRPALPPWVTQEVSNDPRYYNNNLMKTPFKTWSSK